MIKKRFDNFNISPGKELRSGLEDLIVPLRDEINLKTSEILASIAHKTNVEFADTNELFKDCDECQLLTDGHLSPMGNEKLAGFIDELLEKYQ